MAGSSGFWRAIAQFSEANLISHTPKPAKEGRTNGKGGGGLKEMID
jgi:hypothetical protein